MEYFIGEIIKSIELNEKQSILTIVTNITTYILDGEGGFRNNSYLETDMNEINKLIGETIISFDWDYVEIGNDNLYFYDFNTINHHVQIMFCGDYDTYYGAEANIVRLPSKNDLYEKIRKLKGDIEKVREEIKVRFGKE